MRGKQTILARVTGPIALLLLVFTTAAAQSQPDVRPLPVGEKIERQLKGDEIHVYTVELKQGQVLRIDVLEKGVGVGIRLIRTSERQIVANVAPGPGYDRKRVTRVIEQPGEYAVGVSVPQTSPGGEYQLIATVKETITATDTEEIKAEQLLVEGFAIGRKGTGKDLQAAAAKWEEALSLWKKLGDKYWEGYTITFLGVIYSTLGENPKALSYFTQALPLLRSVGDKHREALTLNNLGRVHNDSGENQKALEFFNQALSLQRELGNKRGEALTLNNIGALYSDLGESQKALEFYNESLPLRRAVGDRGGEAATLNNIGEIYSTLGQKQKALDFYEQALPLLRSIGDKGGEATTLGNIGAVYSDLGEKQKALEFYNQSLPPLRLAGDKSGEATTLNNIGEIYYTLGENQKALEFYDQALTLRREVGDRRGEAAALTNIGAVYSDLGEKQKASEFYDQALSVYRLVGDKSGQATSLNNIGELYSASGENQKALDFFNQALPLIRLAGGKRNEARTLNNIGKIYSTLGESQKALDFYNQALPLLRSVGDKSGEAVALNNIGRAYSSFGENQKALEFFNQALQLRRSVNDKRGEGVTLNNIGAVYSDLGEKQKALEFYNQSLTRRREVGDKNGEGTTLSNIGAVYFALGEEQKALEFFNQSLPLQQYVGDPNGEGITLSNLMSLWKTIGKPRLATFYGKQSVNAFQRIRANIQSLDKGVQKSFLATKEATYRALAELLISQNRLQEAAQVLDLLKLQEFSDFVNRSGSAEHPTAEADYSPSEAEKNKQYDQLTVRLVMLNSEHDNLSQKKGRTPEEEQRLATLGQEIEGARQQFQQFIAQLPDYFSPPLTAQEAGIEINGIKPIVRDLGAGTVALYTLIAQDRYYVILISPQADQVRHYAIRRDELENKVVEFKRAVQNRERDPQPKAHELYQILLAPIDTELQQAGARTLMWSLDGVLRYLPISALHDGQQYVVAKYQNVVIDPTSQSRLREQPAHLNWRGLGLGTSKAFAGLKALSNVPEELDEIIREEGGKDERGVLPGEAMLNESFTELRMFEALKRNYTVVHIASHFVLSAKDASQSYLLLGDGNRLKLSQISEGAKIFDRVDLVALSACDTASGGEDADGREVDAFGIITQQKGARAVLASLWPVEDRSTKDLMVDFYQRLRGAGQLSKAEALRLAQLGLLRGGVQGLNAQDSPRSDSDKKKDPVKVKEMQWEEETGQGPEFKVDPKARYGHPYYWAPFILIGNWK